MRQKIYQIDAFTDKIFRGNPAAVCPLEAWLPDELMQNIAKENNLAETAFYVPTGEEYLIRWFTPRVEVDLCGHATLAAAYVLFNLEKHAGPAIRFYSPRSGELTVTRHDDLLSLNFPSDTARKEEISFALSSAFNIVPLEILKGKTDYLYLFENEEQIRRIIPHLDCISDLDARGVIITAKGNEVDFVSRFFAPQVGVNEDPVTSSAHTLLTPFWAKRLGKTHLTALQLSDRQGQLSCTYLHDRVEISGQARHYLTGEIFVD
ncbi:MAG: PhzF family phenazine biosynthesis protein [Bacteroidota bacterium]|nr:PhzF family phenazine biosynthesis protein [Bacteroidota bacterium]